MSAANYRYVPGVSIAEDIDLDETPVSVGGRRYTEADAEADSVAAERRQLAGLVPGGKSLSGGRTHSPAVRVVLPEDTLAEVKRQAANRHMSISRFLRGLIEREL
ncbi:MAG: DNA-binding protein, partial [Propionibacteriaceae bacterium]|nr:DNA-binding protein [Propionibacteriaceae bacterium]